MFKPKSFFFKAMFIGRDIYANFPPSFPFQQPLIIRMALKIIVTDTSAMCGVLRVIGSTCKDVGAAPIANQGYPTC